MRKSQHYILGNWVEYIDWFDPKRRYAFNHQLLLYYMYFPIAYCKFMYYALSNLEANQNEK